MRQERINYYEEIEKLRNAKLTVYITGDRPGMETQIHPEVLEYFVDHLDHPGKVDKISLMLYLKSVSMFVAKSKRVR